MGSKHWAPGDLLFLGGNGAGAVGKRMSPKRERNAEIGDWGPWRKAVPPMPPTCTSALLLSSDVILHESINSRKLFLRPYSPSEQVRGSSAPTTLQSCCHIPSFWPWWLRCARNSSASFRLNINWVHPAHRLPSLVPQMTLLVFGLINLIKVFPFPQRSISHLDLTGHQGTEAKKQQKTSIYPPTKLPFPPETAGWQRYCLLSFWFL